MAAWLERAQNRTILLRKTGMGRSFHGVSFGFYYCDGKKKLCKIKHKFSPKCSFDLAFMQQKTLQVTAAPLYK